MTEPTASGLSARQPFPGLRPFAAADHDYFFGRDDQVFSLYRLLDRSRFVAVVGSSGSGKSSLVRAGLLPLLETESDPSGGPLWRIVEMRPGDRPIDNLADGLVALYGGDDPADIEALRERIPFVLRRSSFGLRDALDELGIATENPVILVVDQFEELFRFSRVSDAEERREQDAVLFVQLLLELSRHWARRAHVLITMRSDFIGDCALFQGLPEVVSGTQFLVPSLTRDQVEEVIRRPITKAGATIDPAVAERLINDTGSDLDALPVLQHCLLRLWEQAVRDPADGKAPHLRAEHYEAIGGMANALSRHADEVLSELSGHDAAVELVFRALSEIDNEGRAVRRALPLMQLAAETGVDADELRSIIDRFRAPDCSFLTTSPPSVANLEPATRIDVGHEALLRRWERVSAAPSGAPGDESEAAQLGGWLRVEEYDGRLYRGLVALGASPNVTLPLDQVEKLTAWWRRPGRPRTAAWAERYGGGFDRVTALFERSTQALEDDRHQREAAAKAIRDAETARRRAQRWLLTGTSIGLVVALCLVALSFWQWSIARAERDRAQRALAAMGMQSAQTEQEVDRKLLNGSEELRRALSSDRNLVRDPEQTESAAEFKVEMWQLMTNADPKNIENQIGLARAYVWLGDVRLLNTRERALQLPAYQAGRAIRERLFAAHPESTMLRRDLALSVDRIGDFFVADGHANEAEEPYRRSLELSSDLVMLDPNNANAVSDRAISYFKIAELRANARDLGHAIDLYKKSLADWNQVASLGDLNGRQELTIADVDIEIGSLLQDDDRDQAASYYTAARQRLATLSQDSTEVTVRLQLVNEKLAKLLEAQGKGSEAAAMQRASLSVAERQVHDAPGDTGKQYELAMQHSRLGAILMRQGDLEGALREQHAALDIVQQLAGRAPDQPALQSQAAAIETRIADLLIAQHKTSDALPLRRDVVALRERLANAEPHDVQKRIDLVVAYWLAAADGDEPERRLTMIVATLKAMQNDRQLTQDQANWAALAETQLKQLRH